MDNLQAGSGVRPTSYSMGTVGLFREVKRPGRDVDRSPSSSVKIKNGWCYNSTSPYAFMACTEANERLRSLLFRDVVNGVTGQPFNPILKGQVVPKRR